LRVCFQKRIGVWEDADQKKMKKHWKVWVTNSSFWYKAVYKQNNILMNKENKGIKKDYQGLNSRAVTKLSTDQMARVFGAEGGSPDTNVRTTSTVCFETEGKKEKNMGQTSNLCS
jgi:hypothetical protein